MHSSIGQNIKSFAVTGHSGVRCPVSGVRCPTHLVCVRALSRSQFLTNFDEIGTDVWNLTRKIPFVGGENPLKVSLIFTPFYPKLAPT